MKWAQLYHWLVRYVEHIEYEEPHCTDYSLYSAVPLHCNTHRLVLKLRRDKMEYSES